MLNMILRVVAPVIALALLLTTLDASSEPVLARHGMVVAQELLAARGLGLTCSGKAGQRSMRPSRRLVRWRSHTPLPEISAAVGS